MVKTKHMLTTVVITGTLAILLWITDVDECEEDVNGIMCPDTSKCVNLDPVEGPNGFRCECPNGKPAVN